MTSPRKIAASRINGCKSRGPRTQEGKTAASRNALRHGLTTISYRNPAFVAEIERVANILCEGDSNPHLFRCALAVAQENVILRYTRRERVVAIERCYDKNAIAHAKGDNSLALAKARHRRTELALSELQRMGLACDGADLPAHVLDELEQDTTRREYPPLEPPAEERNDVDAFCEALPDLMRLGRYERRACARLKRAVRDFAGMLPWDNNQCER